MINVYEKEYVQEFENRIIFENHEEARKYIFTHSVKKSLDLKRDNKNSSVVCNVSNKAGYAIITCDDIEVYSARIVDDYIDDYYEELARTWMIELENRIFKELVSQGIAEFKADRIANEEVRDMCNISVSEYQDIFDRYYYDAYSKHLDNIAEKEMVCCD